MMNTMARIMDRETAEHFYAWLDRTIPVEEQNTAEESILALLADYPDMVRTHSWPEMLDLAFSR